MENELDEPVRLNRPRDVLDGSWPASVETVPLAGLYIAAGILGRLGTDVSREMTECLFAGIWRGPRGAGGGGAIGAAIGVMGCVLMRGSCFVGDAGPPRLANLALRSLEPVDARLPAKPGLMALPWRDCGFGCTAGFVLVEDAVDGRASFSVDLLETQC